MAPAEICAICARSILKGERTRGYITPDGERREVCDLCLSRAESVGWIWEELAAEQPAASPRQRRRRDSLVALVKSRIAAARAAREAKQEMREQGPSQNGEPAEPAAAEEPDHPEAFAPERALPSRRPERSPDPAAPGAGVGRPPPITERSGSRLERAIERFNHSEHARTVAGLMKSLGGPWVSVGAAARSPSDVRITVAWELSWYQWAVDMRNETAAVHELAKGQDVSELDRPARQWNAHAVEGGRLVLGPHPEQPAAAAAGVEQEG